MKLEDDTGSFNVIVWPDLARTQRRWIVAQAEAGCQLEEVVQAMVASGWLEDVAIEALEQTLRGRLEEVRQVRQAPAEGE